MKPWSSGTPPSVPGTPCLPHGHTPPLPCTSTSSAPNVLLVRGLQGRIGAGAVEADFDSALLHEAQRQMLPVSCRSASGLQAVVPSGRHDLDLGWPSLPGGHVLFARLFSNIALAWILKTTLLRILVRLASHPCKDGTGPVCMYHAPSRSWVRPHPQERKCQGPPPSAAANRNHEK